MDNSIIVYQSKSEQMMDERNAQFIKDHPDLAYGVQLGFGVFVIGFIAFIFIKIIKDTIKNS
jgi:hypothetical protein